MKSFPHSLRLLALAIAGYLLLTAVGVADEKNSKCPIMTEDPADPEFTVEYEGKKVFLCCGKCAKIWNKNPKYIIKASADLLPQFAGMEKKLELDAVKLLEQRRCPVKSSTLVTPESPTVQYKGQTIYLADNKAVATWNKDPDGAAKKAMEAGLLPQLAPKK